jgi:plasmid stability protein
MATLNVKNLPDDLYEKLKARAARDNRSVAREIVVLLTAALDEGPSQSILQLRGMGKELWVGIDAAEHVKVERDSWD